MSFFLFIMDALLLRISITSDIFITNMHIAAKNQLLQTKRAKSLDSNVAKGRKHTTMR
jgi:hypothetical protein